MGMGLRAVVGPLVVLALVVVPAACSDSAPSDASPSGCASGERSVGSACVAEDFFAVQVPQSSDWQPIDTDPDGTSYAHAILLVSLRDASTSASDASALFSSHGGQVVGAIPFAGFYTVRFADAATGAALDAKAAELTSDAKVAVAGRDLVIESGLLSPDRPADTDLEQVSPTTTYHDFYDLVADAPIGAGGTWAYRKVRLFEAWSSIYAHNDPLTPVVVGVLDGRIERTLFPALSFPGSHDLRVFGNETAASESVRHGTAVASIIGAPNDRLGMNGFLSGLACIPYDMVAVAVTEDRMGMPLPPPRGNQLTVDALFYGIVYAVQAGARVVNISMGATASSGSYINNLARNYRLVMGKAHDTLFVLGGGNDDTDANGYLPCDAAQTVPDGTTIPNALCVSATDENDAQAVWFDPRDGTTKLGASNKNESGDAIGIAAPGIRQLAELPDGRLTMFSGTSGAAPMVSGAAALLFAVAPSLDGGNAKRLLIETAAPIGDQTLSGRRLDVGAAVDRALALAEQLHPEQIGMGTCRAPADDAGAPEMCAPNAPCSFCFQSGTATIQNTGTMKTSQVMGTGGGATFGWADDTSLRQVAVTVSDATYQISLN
ncbi:MAG TPA: S8 family serine peptidase, partial [Labilithrix sp.]